MQYMAGEYPGICRLDTMGKSVGGRNLLVLKITDNPDVREPEPVHEGLQHSGEHHRAEGI